MSDILFINPYPEEALGINETTLEPPIGLGYLAAVAEQKGLHAEIIDANVLMMEGHRVVEEIVRRKPSVVGITINIITYKSAVWLIKKLNETMPDTRIIVGGPFPTVFPEKTLTVTQADACIVGEGEDTLAEILDRLKGGNSLFEGIDGVIYRKKAEIVSNRPRGFIKDIDSIPMPAYHLYPDLKLYRSRSKKTPIAPLLTSRGCPFQCTFCSRDVFQNVCRLRSPENVVQEIDLLVKEFGVRQLDILDDNFAISKKRTEAILDMIIARSYDLSINLQSGIRIEGLDQNIIDKMKRAGVYKMAFGVESGDRNILKRIKKKLDLEKLLETSVMAKKAGIMVNAFFMLGLPGDTPETMQKTIDLAIEMNPNTANFNITIPFPGTELFEEIKEHGRFLVDIENGLTKGFYANKIFFELDGMDSNTVLAFYKKAYRDFYFRPKKIIELLSGISSWSELRWIFSTSAAMIRNLFM